MPHDAEREKEARLLLALSEIEGGGAFQKELKPEPTPKVREALAEEGLIQISKKNRSIWLELTDAGRERARTLPPLPAPGARKPVGAPARVPQPVKLVRTKAQVEQEKEALLLLSLLACDEGGALQQELSPAPSPALRAKLQAEGLITVTKEGRSNRIEATDRAWSRAGANLSSLLPESATGAAGVLRQWLVRLEAFMKARDLVLADVLAPTQSMGGTLAAPAQVAAPSVSLDLPARIRAAYLDVTGGRLATRALLKDLRPRLPDVPREVLDEALKQMQRDQAAILYRLDNTVELTAADHAAALHITGEPRHILWIKA